MIRQHQQKDARRVPRLGCPSLSILYPYFWKRRGAAPRVSSGLRVLSVLKKAPVFHNIYTGFQSFIPDQRAISAWPNGCGK